MHNYVLDVSNCTMIGARSLEAFHKNCKSLVIVRRVIHPIDVIGKMCQNEKAHGIGNNMPKLCHLDTGYMFIKTKDVVKIAAKCHDQKFAYLCAY